MLVGGWSGLLPPPPAPPDGAAAEPTAQNRDEMPARMARFGEGATVGFQKAVFVLPPPQFVARGLREGTGSAPLSRLVFLVEVYGAPPP